MIADAHKVRRPRTTALEVILALVFLFLVFRFTAAAVFLVLALLYIFFPLHRSRRAIIIAYVLFFAALLIPVDVYAPGFHGPLYGSKHSGLRFVYVVHGKPRIQRCLDMYGEFIADGCVGGLYDTRWRLVWD